MPKKISSGRKIARYHEDYGEDDPEHDYDEHEDHDDEDETSNAEPRLRGKSLKVLLAPGRLQEYGWNRSFERGVEYYRSGAVKSLVQHGDRLNASVRGTRNYSASIWLENGRLKYGCSCPAGGFCKHLMAAAMAWNAGKADVLDDLGDAAAPTGKSVKTNKKSKQPDLRTYLLSLDKTKLADIILEQAISDDILRERLRVAAIAANPDGADLASLRQRIDNALELPDFDYDNRHWDDEDPYEGYADQLKPILDALELLLSSGQAASVATLAEYALTELNKQCSLMEHDFGEPEAMIDPLVALHVRACSETKPEPTALAEWLFRFGIRDPANQFGSLPWEKYKPVLNKAGLERFRQLVEAEWEKIPAKTASTGSDPQWHLRRRLQEIMMGFAEENNDIDAQAAVVKKDLSSQRDYARLVEIFKSAKRHNEALEWAEKGWKAFPDQHGRSPELRDLLAGEYRRNHRQAEAMALYWNEFAGRPGLPRYQELKKQADKNGDWTAWREKAFTFMRERIAAAKDKRKSKGSHAQVGGWNFFQHDSDKIESGDHSLLVEILLWENKPAEAWTEAQAGGCSEDWWLKLSNWREKTHPEDCVPIWRRRIERLTQHADQQAYAPAAESLVRLGALMERTGEGRVFTDFMRRLREEQKRRRNFIVELDKRKLP